jgi:hypothetical protein
MVEESAAREGDAHDGPVRPDGFWPLDDVAMRTVGLLLHGSEVLLASLPPAWIENLSADITGLALPNTTPLTISLNALTRRLLAYVFAPAHGTPAAGHALERAIVEAEDAMLLLADATGAKRSRRPGAGAQLQVAEFVRIAGLDGHDRLCILREMNGALGVAWNLVAPERVTAALLDNLYRHVAFFARRDPLGRLELDAAHWYFRNHAYEPSDPGLIRSQMFRLAEWCLIDRPSLALETSFLDAFSSHDAFQHLTARQQHYAAALQRKVTSIFEVIHARRDDFTVRDLVTGERFDIRSAVLHPANGVIVFGSLIPFAAGWQSSPGCMTVTAASPAAVRTLADAFQDHSDRVPAAIRVELLISSAVFSQVPEDLPPFQSVSEARQAGAAMMTALIEAGLCVPPPGWPPRRAPDGTFLDYVEPIVVDPDHCVDIGDPAGRAAKIDVVVTTWLLATHELVSAAQGGSRRPGRRSN